MKPKQVWEFFPEVGERMDEGFMKNLIALRKFCDFPFPVTSSYRPPPDKGNHSAGRAADINVWGENAFKIIRYAPVYGMTGIGIKQHGSHNKRFIHLDNMPNGPGKPRPTVWTYE